MVSRREKIGEQTIKGLQPGDTVTDTLIPGFMIRRRADAISFSLKYLHEGRQRIATIGRYGVAGLTVAKARREAERIRGTLRQGADPQAARDAAKAARTLGEVVDEFKRLHIVTLKPSTQAGYIDLLDRKIAPALGHHRIDKVTKAHVRHWHMGMVENPATANLSLRIARKLFSWALEHDYIKVNPATGIKQFQTDRIERYLDQEETQRLWAALETMDRDGSTSPSFTGGVRLLLLTGARLNEIFEAKWSWLDVERAQINVPEAKGKTKNRVIRLSPDALAIIQALPRFKNNDYLLPGSIEGQPYIARSKPWARLLRLAKIETRLRIHDLRHSWASQAVSEGASLYVVGKHLGHSNPSTTQKYAHLAPDVVRDLAQSVSERIAQRASANKKNA